MPKLSVNFSIHTPVLSKHYQSAFHIMQCMTIMDMDMDIGYEFCLQPKRVHGQRSVILSKEKFPI